MQQIFTYVNAAKIKLKLVLTGQALLKISFQQAVNRMKTLQWR